MYYLNENKRKTGFLGTLLFPSREVNCVANTQRTWTLIHVNTCTWVQSNYLQMLKLNYLNRRGLQSKIPLEIWIFKLISSGISWDNVPFFMIYFYIWRSNMGALKSAWSQNWCSVLSSVDRTSAVLRFVSGMLIQKEI